MFRIPIREAGVSSNQLSHFAGQVKRSRDTDQIVGAAQRRDPLPGSDGIFAGFDKWNGMIQLTVFSRKPGPPGTPVPAPRWPVPEGWSRTGSE